MQAMQWVLALTAILLYASGITFRSIVDRGIIKHSFDAQLIFSSVPQSMFYLFRLMNGLTPADCILLSGPLRLLYIFFLVISNWAVLAILTAVVSDNMILSTQDHERIEASENLLISQENRRNRLREVFEKLDKDCNGNLSETEFRQLMEKRSVSGTLWCFEPQATRFA